MAAPGAGAAPRARYHWLRLRAVAHPTEDPAKVEAALRFVGAFEGPAKDTPMDTHHGLTLHVLEATVDKSRAIRDVLERLFALPGALDRLRATADARVDDDGILYLRLDKQAAHAGRLELLDGEDAVQLRLKLETYPATREAALAAIQAVLASGRP